MMMNFDGDKFARRMKNAAQGMVRARVSERSEVLRCNEHPGSRITVTQAASGDSNVSIPQCCNAFVERARAALKEIGARPTAPAGSSISQAVTPEHRPLAFISHSSSDKERIARPLDQLLRDRGIRVWLDERDLLPGHNLVDEIFGQAISRSDAFIAILTANSIDSKWVHEELTNAVVQKIDGVVKIIIPVILDGVNPPEFLKHTVWEVINDDNLALHADRIAAAIIGRQPVPVAPAPEYAGIPVHRLRGLTPDDERIFVAAVRQVLDPESYYPVVAFSQLFEYGKSVGMSEEQVEESIAALEQGHYFRDVLHGLGERYPDAGRISDYGLAEYLRHYMPKEYRDAKFAIVNAIVNENADSSTMMSLSLKIHEAIVEHILTELERGNHVIASHSNEGIHIYPNPTIRRVLRDLESER